MITLSSNEETRIEAFEFMRFMRKGTEESIEFADFAVGFPDEVSMPQRYISFYAAKHGPEAISTDTQEYHS